MSDYTLALSDEELLRYRGMAERARDAEVDLWAAAGLVQGASVADVGCGPAAVSVMAAEAVGPTGRVIGIERDPAALAMAEQVVRTSGVSNVELRSGTATETGLDADALDVVMMRHVLAHNGGKEQAIVDHLASVVRPDGHVYLVDVDLTASRLLDADPDLLDIGPRYAEFHTTLGNDPMVGLRLSRLVEGAGLELVRFEGKITISEPPPGVRPPAWAAREAMLAAGVVTSDDVVRWDAAFNRAAERHIVPTIFIPLYFAIGRRPA